MGRRKSRIYIKPANRGKLRRSVKSRTKKGTIPVRVLQRLKKSKNPKTRKRATFALNAKRWGKRRRK